MHYGKAIKPVARGERKDPPFNKKSTTLRIRFSYFKEKVHYFTAKDP